MNITDYLPDTLFTNHIVFVTGGGSGIRDQRSRNQV